jgi:glycosyltransferase involved in cell wall biosynthesis
MRKKILFVAFPNSIHTAKWLKMLEDQNWEVHLYSSIIQPLHPNIKNVIFHNEKELDSIKDIYSSNDNKSSSILIKFVRSILKVIRSVFKLPLLSKLKNFITDNIINTREIVDLFLINNYKLTEVIKKVQPDLIHSMEIQSAGYLVLNSKLNFSKEDRFPKWLATNWGSDIYYYQKFPWHRRKIKKLLQNIDYYSCEVERDIKLAKKYGLKGKSLPVLPNTVGIELEKYREMRFATLPSKRKYIMIKGYQNFAGRALTALEAIEKCKAYLQGYEILVYSASDIVKERIKHLQSKNFNINYLPPVPNDEIMKLHSLSRLHIAISISDGISTAMLEAMVMGSFPIQTNTSGADEWLKDGITGFIVPPNNTDMIADRIKKALENDELVDNAAIENWKVAELRLDYNIVKQKIIEEYNKILSN